MNLQKKAFPNILGNATNAGNQHSPLPTMFSICSMINFNFESCLCCCRHMLSIWISLKFCCLVRTENILGNADQLHFLLFPQCFKSCPSQGHSKSGLCGKELKQV